MPHVCNDPDLMRELEREWRGFRETAGDGAARLDRMLQLDVGRSWRDRRFDDYRERFDRDMGLLLRTIDDGSAWEARDEIAVVVVPPASTTAGRSLSVRTSCHHQRSMRLERQRNRVALSSL
jgi:hypothetical protein